MLCGIIRYMNLNKYKKILFFTTIIFSVFIFSPNANAKVGVGMGAGKIRVSEPVKLGGIYELPSIRVFNTGDEITTYSMNIAFHQDKHELRPSKEWFSFKPSTFTVKPNESQEISIKMTVPLETEPGDYFAFIESGPVPTNAQGTSVGIAVATKLYFKLIPANIFQAMTYRVSSFFDSYSPVSWIFLGVVIFIILIVIIRKFFSFNIAIKKN